MRQIWLVIVTGCLLSCGATAPDQNIRFARAAEHGRHLDWTRPVVLQFEPGDRVPVRVDFSDQIFELSPASPSLELVAKRRGFVRIDRRRITGSLTGDDFEAAPLAPGQFRFGLAITPAGAALELAVKTPQHAEVSGRQP